MKKIEEVASLRGKLMLTGTLAMFAMGVSTADAATAKDTDETKPAKPGTDAASTVKDDQRPAALSEVHKFDIPAGSVGEVIEAVQKVTGIRISMAATDEMSAIASPGVHGVVTVQEALEQALLNTGLAARVDSPNSMMIEVRGSHEDVVVTANALPSMKYTAPLLDLPQTISLVTQETMTQTASTTLVEALRTVPGITFGAGEGGNPLGDRPFIRGIDAQSSTYIDGVRDIAAQSREVFDIDSIEVQEGPGGAYGGRGTGGGSINMNSKLARRDNFISGTFMPGTAGYKRGTVDGNVKLGRFVAARLTGMGHDADVNGRDAVHNSRWGIAPSVAIGLGRPTRAYLDYYHLITNNLPDSGVPYNNPAVPTSVPKNYGPQLYQRGDGEPISVPYRGIFWGVKDRDQDREAAKIATGRVERDLFHERSLVRNTFRYDRTEQNYLWTLPDDSKGNILYGYLFRRINSRVQAVFTTDNQTDLSGTVKTGKMSHSYAAGVEFSNERSNVDTYSNNSLTYGQTGAGSETCPNGAGAASGYNCTLLYSPDFHDNWNATGVITQAHNPAHYTTGTRSLYGFDTIQFNSHFQSTLGARYDHYDSVYHSAKSTTGVVTSQEVVNNIGNYLGSVIYKPDHATSLYGSISTSAIPSGATLAQGTDTASLTTTNNNLLPPQFIRQEEFGAKRELAGGRALGRIDFYRTDIQNVRITQADGSIAAAGNNRTLGAQIGLSGMVTRKWQLTGGYGYIDATLLNAGFTASTVNGVTTYAASTSNRQMLPNTPRHSASVTSSYRITRRLSMGGGVYAMTKVWGSQANNKWVPGYARVDFNGSYEFSRHYSFQANVQNLTDKLYYQQAYATHYAVMAPGRSAVFGVTVKF